MTPEVSTDLLASKTSFEGLVWPAVSKLVGGGEIIPVESERLRVALGACASGRVKDAALITARIDELCGIDAYQIVNNGLAVRAIASRVQAIRDGWERWDSFTIRYTRPTGATTEWEKRLLAIQNVGAGYLYPHLTIQAYLSADRSRLLSAAVCRTMELVEYARPFEPFKRGKTRDRPYLQSCSGGQNIIVIPWEAMGSKYRVLTFNLSEEAA